MADTQKPFSEPSNLSEQMQNLCWRLATEMRALFNTVGDKLSTADADDRYLAKTGKAVSATTADSATTATTATKADSATMAVQDGNGNVISSTYAKNSSLPTTMKGATSSTAGTSGTVPTPAAGTEGKFLRGDGTWQTPSVPTKTSELTNNSGYITSSALSSYVPLAGGTMTGTLVVPNTKNSINGAGGASGYIQINANDNCGGGQIRIYGKSASELPGGINLYVNNGSDSEKALSIKATGSLTWCNNEVLTTANVDSALSTSSTNPVRNSVVTTQINTNANLMARQYLTTMTGLGYTKDSTVAVGDFFTLLASKGYRRGDTIVFEWADSSMAYVTDGTNTLRIGGGTLVLGKLQSHASTWSSNQALWFPNGVHSNTIYMLYSTIGGASGTYYTKGVVPLARKSDITSAVASASIPSGVLAPFAGKTVPSGWLLCNGAAVSRTTYASLFSAIGTTWGTGDGSTTFNLPNCNGRFLEGTTTTSQVGTYLSAGLPNITGRVTMNRLGIDETRSITNANAVNLGASYVSADANAPNDFYGAGWESCYKPVAIHFDASRVSSLYSNSVSAIQPAAVYTLMIIKV